MGEYYMRNVPMEEMVPPPIVPARPIRTDPAGPYRCTACSWAGDTLSNCPKCAAEVTVNDGMDVPGEGKQ